MTDQFWGYHLTIDAKACRLEAAQNGELIAKFLTHLVEEIDMIAHGSPQVVHFGEDNKAGWTGIQLITTSNIVGHWCDDSGDAYFDVFSCRPYDTQKVADLFQQYFAPERMRTNFLTRQA
jgi:S-adenosylmethionine/arginine decarboxylase-like enzyme